MDNFVMQFIDFWDSSLSNVLIFVDIFQYNKNRK